MEGSTSFFFDFSAVNCFSTSEFQPSFSMMLIAAFADSELKFWKESPLMPLTDIVLSVTPVAKGNSINVLKGSLQKF